MTLELLALEVLRLTDLGRRCPQLVDGACMTLELLALEVLRLTDLGRRCPQLVDGGCMTLELLALEIQPLQALRCRNPQIINLGGLVLKGLANRHTSNEEVASANQDITTELGECLTGVIIKVNPRNEGGITNTDGSGQSCDDFFSTEDKPPSMVSKQIKNRDEGRLTLIGEAPGLRDSRMDESEKSKAC